MLYGFSQGSLAVVLFGVQGFNLDMVEGWAFTLTLNLNPKP